LTLKFRRFTVWICTGILLAGIGSWWLARHDRDENKQASPIGNPNAPDYYVKDLDATTMTSAGDPARSLKTPLMRHLPIDDVTEISMPRFSVYQDDGPPWQVRAKRGRISADGDVILLQGEVKIEKAGTPEERPMRLLTRELRIQPAQDYAETDEPVRVSSNDEEIEATGMQAWLRKPIKLKFLSRARGHYVPR